MIFCYKFITFAEFWDFCLAKYRGRLIHGYSKTCIFLAKKQGVDLYTDSTYTPENTVTKFRNKQNLQLTGQSFVASSVAFNRTF